jgi:D-glycero-alpha-D-manno-heptose-7-phosphate kinase
VVITQTPLRVSLLGGGTDFVEYYRQRTGMCVSAAIDKYVFVIVKERFDDLIYINYSRKEIVSSVDDIEHEFVREAMRMTGLTRGVEVTMLADIPAEGSGLGSSSSIVVGLLNAMYAFQGAQIPAETLARQACEIEIERCRKPIGKQDQYIAAYGGLRAFRFCGTGEVHVEQLGLCERQMCQLRSGLMLFYTGITRKAADILDQQRARTSASIDRLEEMVALAAEGRDAIVAGCFDRLGYLIDRSWHIKKTLADGVSNVTIDDMYERAIDAGATGAKVCGAGGGGFLMIYCPHERRPAVEAAMAGYRQVPFGFEKHGSKVIFSYWRS